MTTVCLKESNANGLGTWRRWRGRVFVVCAECGASTGLDRTIDDHGVVTPSFMCPAPHCTWHVMVVLKDWIP